MTPLETYHLCFLHDEMSGRLAQNKFLRQNPIFCAGTAVWVATIIIKIIITAIHFMPP